METNNSVETSNNDLITPETVSEAKLSISHALDRLKTIRTGKTKIIAVLQSFKEKEDNGEVIQKLLVEKLLSSYDALKDQEDEYLKLLLKSFGEIDIPEDALADTNDQTLGKNDSDESSSETLRALLGTLKKARNFVQEQVAQAELNDKLKTSIQLHYEQKKIMEELHKKELEGKTLEAKLALETARAASLKLSSVRSSVERKQQQLERLRQKAAKKGYILPENQTASVDATKVKAKENNPQSSSESESKESDKSETSNTTKTDTDNNDREDAVKKLGAKLEELGIRIPPITRLPVPETVPLGSTTPPNTESQKSSSSDSTYKNDEIRSKISSRFAAFEARKQRMRQLRSKIDTLAHQKMDDTSKDAISRIRDLVQIRSKLEDLQQSSAALHSAGNLASTSFIPSLTETDLTTHTEDPETTHLLLENIPLATETNLSQTMNSGEGRNYHDAKSAAEENSPASSDEVSL